LFEEEQKKGIGPEFIDNYDLIRGRKHNVLEGSFWRINQNIALLAMSGDEGTKPTIRKILDNTDSGGSMMNRENEYYNDRIDLKLVPFHNRILNLCFYMERMPDHSFVPGLEKLLSDKNLRGYCTTEYRKTRWRLYGGDLELFIAAALARCGGEKGYRILIEYLNDAHYNFKKFAQSELREISGKDFGYNAGAWLEFLGKQQYPAKVRKLVKDVEF